jgi:hypothetical protein
MPKASANQSQLLYKHVILCEKLWIKKNITKQNQGTDKFSIQALELNQKKTYFAGD